MKTLSIFFCAALLFSGCTAPLSDEEREFNESGRAKAILDETDLWQVYEDAEAGFTIKYPHSVTLNGDDEDSLRLRVYSDTIEGLEGTMGFNEETARHNVEKLQLGIYGKNVDFPLGVSMKVQSVGDTNAQKFMTLGRFEVCNVTFERTLYFFHNDHQIVITLAGSTSIIESAPEYFTTDEENCGAEQIWDFEKQEQFYTDLANNKGSDIAQEWFDTFDAIVDTIAFTTSPSTTFSALQGKWISEDDPQSIIEFDGNTKRDIYADEQVSEGTTTITSHTTNPSLFVTTEEGDVLEYSIVELSDTNLILRYLARGNTLRYKKM